MFLLRATATKSLSSLSRQQVGGSVGTSSHRFLATAKKNDDVVTKTDIVKEIASTHAVSQVMAGKILDTALDTIMDAVATKKKVTLTKFGSFQATESKARMGRNPHKNEPMMIAASTRVKFKPFTMFKETVSPK